MTVSRGILRLAVVCLWFSFAAQAQEKVITWASNPKYPPYDWSHEENHYDGAAAVLLPLIIPEGYTLRPVMVPWARAQRMAQEGYIDLLVNLRITPERSAWLQFSKNPTFPNPIAVFMRKDNAVPFESWDELKSLRGGVTIGDAFGNGFDAYLKANLKVEAIPNAYSNFRKLESGRIDYFVTGYYMGMTWLVNANKQEVIVPLKPFISNHSIHLGFSRRSPHVALLPEIDRKLAQLAADGTLARILNEQILAAARIPAEVFNLNAGP